MGGLQPWHWVIVIAVFVLLFGAKKLPDAARSLGQSMRIFKSEVKEMKTDSKPEASAPTPSGSCCHTDRIAARRHPRSHAVRALGQTTSLTGGDRPTAAMRRVSEPRS